MQNFLILFREPDGRLDEHSAEEIVVHQSNWKTWLAKWGERLNGGNSLTLNGKMIKGRNSEVINDIHKVGTEIVGGFLLLKAENLDEAVSIVQSCPIFEFDGYAEVRELRS
ncbi:YciI family protein [Chitinophagaceae bacterium 26-R-25]|nr:YciI family protein [Chitinophagaceae bacterium 26-R-25]